MSELRLPRPGYLQDCCKQEFLSLLITNLAWGSGLVANAGKRSAKGTALELNFHVENLEDKCNFLGPLYLDIDSKGTVPRQPTVSPPTTVQDASATLIPSMYKQGYNKRCKETP